MKKKQDRVREAAMPDEAVIDRAVGLEAISIRIPVELLAEMKRRALSHGVGYQPLMRTAMQEYVASEKSRLLACAAAAKEKRNV